ncbi:hypothetical protein FRB93_002842 [Tulasnella sp. JGI-2019a]|nr:hypothetical protein FRB93_002842 [Tulasnella sp. JGI-2019a]
MAAPVNQGWQQIVQTLANFSAAMADANILPPDENHVMEQVQNLVQHSSQQIRAELQASLNALQLQINEMRNDVQADINQFDKELAYRDVVTEIRRKNSVGVVDEAEIASFPNRADQHPEGFPMTLGQLRRISAIRLHAVLTLYGLPIPNALIEEKRALLHVHLGVYV